MTFKIVQGLVGASSQTVAEAKTLVSQTTAEIQRGVLEQGFTNEAATITIYTSVRRVAAGESISTFYRAKDVAAEVASLIRSNGDFAACKNISSSMGEG